MARLPDVDTDVLLGRGASHRGFLRKIFGAECRRAGGVHLAGCRGGTVFADRRVLLPAHRQVNVFRRAGKSRADYLRTRYHSADQREWLGRVVAWFAARHSDVGLRRVCPAIPVAALKTNKFIVGLKMNSYNGFSSNE